MREKLIELLKEAERRNIDKAIPMTMEQREKVLSDGDGYGFYADHLIANGVVISNSETTTKWIPVTERLPEREQAVLVIDRVTGEVTTAYLNFCDSFVFEDGRGHGASHWMPLPQLPKGE